MLGVVGPIPGAAQESTDPGEEFVEVVGLGEVVVGAGIEAGNTITGFDACREHQHRELAAFGSQHTAHRQPVDDRHRHIEQQHIRFGLAHRFEGLGAVVGRCHRVALELQRPHERFTHRTIILGHQDASSHCVRHVAQSGRCV